MVFSAPFLLFSLFLFCFDEVMLTYTVNALCSLFIHVEIRGLSLGTAGLNWCMACLWVH